MQCKETATRTRDLPFTDGKTLPLAPDPPFNYLVVAMKFISVVVFDVVTCRNYQIMFKALTFNDTIPLLAELICMPLDVFIDEILPRS